MNDARKPHFIQCDTQRVRAPGPFRETVTHKRTTEHETEPLLKHIQTDYP